MKLLIMPKLFVQRLNEFIESKSIPIKEFAASLEVTYQSAHHFLSGRANPKLKTLILLSETYPDLDMNWLLTGDGQMGVGKDEKSFEIDSLKKQLKMCQEKTNLLIEMIDNQRLVIDLMKKSQAS